MKRLPRLFAGLALTLLTLCTYWPVLRCDFVDYDDSLYVVNNPSIQDGITVSSLHWAWTATRASNWHPLTWLSHMVDWRLYGPDPWGHHLTNLLLHVANVLLLFFLVSRMTRSVWRSALVAALFAVHPLHVESVAWVAERKDVLSTLFWLLTTWAYLRYLKAPGTGTYLLVLFAYALGLIAKPMLVTLPFALLLLDYWPLGRWEPASARRGPWRIPWALLVEKLPLFVLAAGSSAITLMAQRAGGALRSLDELPLADRVSNTIVSYATYLGRTFWPSRLAVFYPHPGADLAASKVAAAGLLLVVITTVAVRARRGNPYLLVGWLWYMATLVPVIGIVQVGDQASADRYTYVPLIGIFLVLAWGVPDALRALGWRGLAEPADGRYVAAGSVPVALLLLALMVTSRVQVGYWRDEMTLFGHALAVTENNLEAHNRVGILVMGLGRVDEALGHFTEAVRINPRKPRVHYNLGRALAERRRFEEAIAQYREAIRLEPGLRDAHLLLGVALAELGRTQEAIPCYERALALQPDSPEAYFLLGVALAHASRLGEAVASFSEAIRLQPDFAAAHTNLAAAFYLQGEYREAWSSVHAARRRGVETTPAFLQALAERMPDPGE